MSRSPHSAAGGRRGGRAPDDATPLPGDSVILAAGAVVLREGAQGLETVVVHRPKYDDWSLPKGKLDEGEHVLVAAVREVREETALDVVLRSPLPSQEYPYLGRPKVVHYWAGEVVANDPFEPHAEIDALRWVPVGQAAALLSHPRDAELVELAARHPATTPVVVLRHAKARKRKDWHGPDPDRTLDSRGTGEATRVADLLAAYGVGRVVSSPSRRCRDTVAPYAVRRGVEVEAEPTVSEEGFEDDPAAALAAVDALVGHATASRTPVVLCTHRPVLPALLAHLLGDAGLVGPTEPLPPAGMVVLHVGADGVVAVESHTL